MKKTLIALSGWLHWILMAAMVALWTIRGQPSGGDVLWYYVLGFAAFWSVSCAMVMIVALLKARNHPWLSNVHAGWLSPAVLGLASPAVLFAF